MAKPSIVYEKIESDETIQIQFQGETVKEKKKKEKKKTTRRMPIPLHSHHHPLGLKTLPEKMCNSQKTVMKVSPNDTSSDIAL